MEELAVLVGEQGHTIMPAHLEGGLRAENCVGMQLLVLDFDHGARFDEIRKKCERLNLPAAFAYHTYSSSEQEEHFRLVFVHEYPIDDPFVIKAAIAMLHKIFRECDHSCTNLDRIFFGGKQLIYVDVLARIALMQLMFPFYEALDVGGNFKRNIHTFCCEQKILLFNGKPAMGPVDMLPSFD